MSTCCPICLKSSEIKISSSKFRKKTDPTINCSKEIEQKFFNLFQRYTNTNCHNNGVSYPDENEIDLFSCADCLKLMESFCNIYHEMMTLELKLKWKMLTLKNIMKAGGKVPSRLKHLQNLVPVQKMNQILKWRKSLIGKCSQKIRNSLPLVLIENPRSPDTNFEENEPSLDGDIEEVSEAFKNCKFVMFPSRKSKKKKLKSLPPINNIEDIISLPELSNNLFRSKNESCKNSAKTTVMELYTNSDDNISAVQDVPLNSLISDPNEIIQDAKEQRKGIKIEPGEDKDASSSNDSQNNQDLFEEIEIETGSSSVLSESVAELETQLSTIATNNDADTDKPANDKPSIATSHFKPKNVPGRKSSLRSIFTCSVCQRTFANFERFETHQKMSHTNIDKLVTPEANQNSSNNDGGDNDAISDAEIDNEDDDDAIGSLFSSSSSSPDEYDTEDDLKSNKFSLKSTTKCKPEHEYDDGPNTGFNCKFPNCSKIFESKEEFRTHSKIHDYTGDIINIKCPDCPLLSFKTIREILLHRKNSDCCHFFSYNPDESVKVTISFLKNYRTNQVSESTLIINLPQKIFLCDVCDLSYYSEDDLKSHSALHGQFTCNFCPFETNFGPTLSMHECNVHSKVKTEDGKNRKKNYQCARCDFSSPKEKTTYLNHHLEKHLSLNSNLSLQCPICTGKNKDDQFITKNNLGRHLQLYHDLTHVENLESLKLCKVDNCKAYFTNQLSLTNHLKSKHNWGNKIKKINQHKCKDCGQIFYHNFQHLRKHRLRVHIRPEEVIPCPFPKCKVGSESKEDLLWHVMKSWAHHKKISEGPFNNVLIDCPKCEDKINCEFVKNVLKHVKSHDENQGQKLWICDTCGKKFKFKPILEVHQLIHSGPESWQFKCDVCGVKKISKYRLKLHMRTHTKEKPFVCQICGFATTQRGHLRSHMNYRHKGEAEEDKPRKYSKPSN